MVDTSKLEMVTCPKCGRSFPKKRLELGYKYCTNCSTEQAVVGIIESVEEGSDCYTSITICSQQDAFEIKKAQAKFRGERLEASLLEPELNLGTIEDDEEEQKLPTLSEEEAQLTELEEMDGFSETTAEELCRLARDASAEGIEGLFEDEEEVQDFEEQ